MCHRNAARVRCDADVALANERQMRPIKRSHRENHTLAFNVCVCYTHTQRARNINETQLERISTIGYAIQVDLQQY